MAVPGGLRAALSESRRRLVLRRRRQALAWALILVFLFAGAAALVQTLVASPPPSFVPTTVSAPDADGDGVANVVENTLGTDPNSATPRNRLPEAWITEFGLSLSDPGLPDRWAEYPRAGEAPEVYDPEGLPAEYRMTYYEVYVYGRPADFNETKDEPWSNGLDPRKAYVGGSDVPYAWLIHFGLDPFDLAALDLPDPTGNVTWTPREAYTRGLHPRSPDGDADGLRDLDELDLGSDPRRFSTAGTGIADGWIKAHGFPFRDPTSAYQDPDRDGLSNLQEFEASRTLVGERALTGGGLDPRRQSSVDGPIPDGWLVRYGLDALDPEVHRKVTQEEDVTNASGTTHHRLDVLAEYRVGRPPLWNETANGPWMGGSDPTKDDTDGDGLTDLGELIGWDVKRPGGDKHVVSDPTQQDTDSDGLTDKQERDGRVGDLTFKSTDPGAPDSDFDGLLDGEELGILAWRGIRLPPIDPNAEDSDEDGLRDGEEAEYWKDRRDGYALEGRGYEWGPPSGRPAPDVVLRREGVPPATAIENLLPGGDLDRDGAVNLLDTDSDGDGLLDGWEVNPLLYASSPYADERARSATDPANIDTDLDQLPDVWEIQNGVYDLDVGGWNLDPSLWSSFRDDVSDADRDLDDDSVTWYSFRGGQAQENRFRATNKVEFEANSDPNERASAPDGISDGWKIFWSGVYPYKDTEEIGEVYPGAPGELVIPFDRPLPRVRVAEETVTHEIALRRALDVDGQTVRESTCPGVVREAKGLDGTGKVCIVDLTLVYDYRAAAGNLTNPFLDDTDGDTVPDAWEAYWHRLGAGNDRVSPVKVDDDADPDGDRLPNKGEYDLGTNPYQKDSDRGGATDDVESRLRLDGLDPGDDRRALDVTIDTDGDTVPDTKELTGVFDQASGRFLTTDPLHPDTDRDGLLDGRSLAAALQRSLRKDVEADVALVESFVAKGLLRTDYPDGTLDIVGEVDKRTEPTLFSTAGDGVPDGWAIRHVEVKKDVPTGLFAAYSHGRPAWWNETYHGLWHWGHEPGVTPGRDRDGDGLDDLNGEDPLPVANPTNRLPRGDPREPGLDPEEQLARGRAYGGDPLPPGTLPRPRPEVILTLDPLPENVTANGTTLFSGNLTRKGTGEPVLNATVLLSLEERGTVVGVAITNATGGFRAPILVAPQIQAPEGARGIPVFGDAAGFGVHVNAGPQLARVNLSRNVSLFAWSYNESWYDPLPAQARGWTQDGLPAGGARTNESARQPVRLVLASQLALDVPAKAPLGRAVPVNATLRDALGRPVPGAEVTLLPDNVTLVTGADGRVQRNLTFPATPGIHAVNASYNGTASLLASEAGATLRVTEATALELFAPPGTLRPNETFALAGILRTARGQPVVNATVRVGLGPLDELVQTDGDGRFASVVALPLDSPLGNVSMQADFAGNDTLDAARVIVGVAVEGTPRWIVSPLTLPAGGRGVLVATLLDLSGKPLAGREARLLGLDATLANLTDEDGKVRFGIDATGLPPGERALTLRFSDPVLGEAVRGVLLTTTTTTRLSLFPSEPVRGKEAILQGRLTDAAGAPLVRQPILVTFGQQGTRVVTDVRGLWNATFETGAALRPGRLPVGASFPGTLDGVYAPSSNLSSATLRDAPRLVLEDDTVLATRPVLEGELTTRLGEPLPSRQVRFRAPGGDAVLVTDDHGRLRAFLTLGRTQPLGPFDVRITSEGHDLLLGLDESVGLVLKDQGTLSLDLPAAAAQGAQLRVPYAIVDSQGRPVPDARVNLSLGGAPLDVQAAGDVLVVAIPRAAAPGAQKVTARVVSDHVSAPVLVLDLDVRRPTTLRLEEAEPIVPGKPGEIVVHLGAGREDLANESILVLGAGIPILVVTDEQGVARIPVPAGAATTTRFEMAYLGAGQNGAASLVVALPAAAAPLTPTDSLGVYGWLLLALLALGLLVAAYVIRRRREPPAAEVLRKAARRLRNNRSDVRALYDAYLGLLDLAGLDEEAGDTLTFGALLSHFLDERSGAEPDVATLTEIFNKAVYAPEQLDAGSVDRGTAALENVARHVKGAAV